MLVFEKFIDQKGSQPKERQKAHHHHHHHHHQVPSLCSRGRRDMILQHLMSWAFRAQFIRLLLWCHLSKFFFAVLLVLFPLPSSTFFRRDSCRITCSKCASCSTWFYLGVVFSRLVSDTRCRLSACQSILFFLVFCKSAFQKLRFSFPFLCIESKFLHHWYLIYITIDVT